MSFVLAGTNYKYAPLALREKIAFSKKGIYPALEGLFDKETVSGAVILSTCQRTEVYAEAEDGSQLRDFVCELKGVEDLSTVFYVKHDAEAVLHLFTVAAGLDSQIIGESEILGQVKDAYFLAKRFEATTPFLNKVFERSLFVGRSVRQNALFSQINSSVASLGVDQAELTAGGLRFKKVFVVGAGTVARDIAFRCVLKGASCSIVATRNFAKAQEVACAIGAEVVSFDEFYKRLDEADILFSATASPHLLLKKELFHKYRHTRKPVLFFALPLPRDIDPKIGQLDNVRLLNLDDLMPNRQSDDAAVREASRFVLEKAQRFLWKSTSAYVPVL